MNMQEIRTIAQARGLPLPGQVTKLQLIRRIQSVEGNLPCFATTLSKSCAQTGCMWRTDCLRIARQNAQPAPLATG